jgi:hypothetical protein
METMRFGLTGIYVDDQDRAEKIYTEALGLQSRPTRPPESSSLPRVAGERSTDHLATLVRAGAVFTH